MVNVSINQPELSQTVSSLYHQVIQESEQALEKFPLEKGQKNRDNLLAFLALQKHQFRELYMPLAAEGVTPLEFSTAHVLFTMGKILNHLDVKTEPPARLAIPTPIDSKEISERKSAELFGKRQNLVQSAIMVTLDAKMIHEPEVMKELLLNGMEIARINCAHNHQGIWKQIIEGLREAEKKLNEERICDHDPCKIYMDLAGPKVRIGKLQQVEISVIKGDILRLYLDPEKAGHPASADGPAGVPVTLEKAFRNVRLKDRIFIDDGKINGVVQQIQSDYIEINILSPAIKPLRIKEGKGVNLPDSLPSLNVPALTEKDLNDLPFIIGHADIVGISFVHSPLDLENLREAMKRYNGMNLGVVAKIETKDAVHQTARIILEGLKFNSFGIMIARGDLAVEVGPENLALVQDEILKICSAAYIPAIWATGVLEKLTKTGVPSRAEMTDASYGKQAACIMLNKGPYIIESLKMLRNILQTEQKFSPRAYSNTYQIL